MGNKMEKDRCMAEIQGLHDYRAIIPEIVEKLVISCNNGDNFEHVGPEPIPSRDAMIELIQKLRRILFPGYFERDQLDKINLQYYLGQATISLFEELAHQITLCIKHDCIQQDLPCIQCEERGREEAVRFIQALPNLRTLLAKDVRAAYEGDPAAGSYDEIILAIPVYWR